MEKSGSARKPADDNIIQRMRLACWITKSTDPRSENVILFMFTRQKWLNKRVSVLGL